MKRTLKEIGEFEFIRKLPRGLGRGVELGIGDDTAVLRIGGKRALFTTDMLIEGKHFRKSEATAFEIGWKALAVNISDIAAMGGVPTHAVAALGAPGGTKLAFLEGIYKGMRAAAKPFGVNLVGGDTNAADKLVISVALLGEMRGPVVTRSGARPGDVIFVSGALGNSYRSRKHLRFMPRVRESQFLTKNFKVHAMMDLSDGLASDIRRICEASKAGARLFEVSVPRAKGASLSQALSDGEDFELLFTLSPKDAAKLVRGRKKRGLAPFRAVGKIKPASYGIRLVDSRGSEKPLKGGFDHFK